MLSNANLGKNCREAVHTTCYLINRSLSATIGFKGKAPSYENLRVFSCTAYIHVNEGKLEPRSKKAIFLGYLKGVKGYKVWLISPNRGKKKRCLEIKMIKPVIS